MLISPKIIAIFANILVLSVSIPLLQGCGNANKGSVQATKIKGKEGLAKKTKDLKKIKSLELIEKSNDQVPVVRFFLPGLRDQHTLSLNQAQILNEPKVGVLATGIDNKNDFLLVTGELSDTLAEDLETQLNTLDSFTYGFLNCSDEEKKVLFPKIQKLYNTENELAELKGKDFSRTVVHEFKNVHSYQADTIAICSGNTKLQHNFVGFQLKARNILMHNLKRDISFEPPQQNSKSKILSKKAKADDGIRYVSIFTNFLYLEGQNVIGTESKVGGEKAMKTQVNFFILNDIKAIPESVLEIELKNSKEEPKN